MYIIKHICMKRKTVRIEMIDVFFKLSTFHDGFDVTLTFDSV